MNPRVLELLKNPKNIQSEDVKLLKEEISAFPYIQNIRALHLYGVHLYDRENYQKELSVTAAYTTDKKILYQLINGKIQQKPKPEIVEEIKEEIVEPVQETEILQDQPEVENKIETEKNQFEEAACLLQNPQPEIKHIYVNGERNRILFEGEENFLDDDSLETIDQESTLESGIIVTQKKEKVEEPETISSEQEEQNIDDGSELSFHETEAFLPEVNIQANTEEIKNEAENSDQSEGIAEFTPETIINEEKITSETEEKSVQDDSELSFHGLESFLPNVTIQSGNSDQITKPEISQPNINKHEEEMRRLIEEVEKKMKAKKETSPEKREDEPEIQSHEISFAETQSFDVASSEPKEEPKIEEKKPQLVENELKSEENQEIISEENKPVIETQEETKTSWKPMSFESHVPDSMINKTVETPQPKVEIVPETPKQEEILPSVEKMPEMVEDHSEKLEEETEELKEDKETPKTEIKEETKEEVPVMNVSFFSSNWNINEPKKEEKEEVKEETTATNVTDSNIPGFINTWQSWLKIDRTQEVDKPKTENKFKVIDSFIENNPKISQLKEESSFVIKEKTDDISHLMTETLANLYFEQKLYTKAINAFQLLTNKHPEKKDYFEAKIQEIKDIRGKN